MKLQKKPKKPVRRKGIKEPLGTIYCNDLDGCSLGIDLARYLNPNIDLSKYSNVILEYDAGFNDGYMFSKSSSYSVYEYREESHIEYNKRLISYEKRKENYDNWYKNNEKAILQELDRRKKEVKLKKKKI